MTKKKVQRNYPIQLKRSSNNVIVEFVSEFEGSVVDPAKTNYDFGYNSRCWISSKRPDNWSVI